MLHTSRPQPPFYLTKREAEAMQRTGGPVYTPNGSCKGLGRLGRRLLKETKAEIQRQYDEFVRTGVAPAVAHRKAEEAAQLSLITRSRAQIEESGLPAAPMYRYDFRTKTGDVDCPFCDCYHRNRPSGPVPCAQCERRFRAVPPKL